MTGRRDTALRLVGGVAGLAAPVVLCWGVLTSLGGLPRFSLRHGFISELAVPWNRYAVRLDRSFVIGGALVVAFAVLATVRARTWRGRIAGGLTMLAGLGVMGVGLFPLTRPWPHLGAVLVLGPAALAAGLVAATAARRSARQAPDDRLLGVGSWLALALALAAAVTAIGAVGYFFWVSAHAWPGSIGRLFQILPQALRIESGGELYNPLAMLEWLLFGLLALEQAGFAAAQLCGWAPRAGASPDSASPAGVR